MLDLLALVVYLAGSYFNTGSELGRYIWKQHPGHQGQLYTGGLFAYAVHINYFGDVLLFSGFALLTHRLIAFVIPLFMLCLFVFVNIPLLDAHLKQHYGPAFDAYARRTRKLIPFIY
jgi:steroid 5-alpha reductase family enzyme